MYVADFETTTDPDDCRVWAWGVCAIDNTDNFTYGNNIAAFIDWCKLANNDRVYFHNLRFDGEFLLSYLLNNGFSVLLDGEKAATNTIKTMISDKGVFYKMTVYFKINGHKTSKIDFYDSLKVLPFSVAEIAKAFNLSIQKLEIDYDEYRAPGHQLTDHEIQYLKNDIVIVAMALKELFSQGLDKMTTASNALYDYKQHMSYYQFMRLFPTPNYDADIRQSYRGGYCYAKKELRGKILHDLNGYDINSLYPSVMRNYPLPFGEGVFFSGKYRESKIYPLYVQMLKCQFDLKPGYLPTIQLKNNLSFVPTEYVESTNDEIVTICLTSVDLEIFLEHYELYNVEYLGGWKFRASTGNFAKYVDFWTMKKIEAKKNKNFPLYTIAKLMLNSLYGKFATAATVQNKYPYLDESGVIRYRLGEKLPRKPLYIPVGAFVTAWSRSVTIKAAQTHYDRFVYCDTDSLYLLGNDPPRLDIDDYKLGAWKHETKIKTGKFLRSKTYMIYCSEPDKNDYHWKITCAGMPESCHDSSAKYDKKYLSKGVYNKVTFNNFKIGSQYPGKLKPKHVPGGIVLEEINFTINDRIRGL